MNEETQYLDIISIFHFVVAGLSALFACLPIFHLVVGLTMLAQFPRMPSQGDSFVFPFLIIPVMFVVLPALIILSGWVFAGSVALAGYFIRRRKHHTFCVVMGAVETVFMPFGTVLGVFTIILLMRPAVKALFQGADVKEAS